MKNTKYETFIPYGHQWIDNMDIEEVIKVLKSEWITQGPKIKEFEELICQYVGAKYCVTVSSGTAALHLAALASGIKPNDEIITSPISFVATSNCILYAGGVPKFIDINRKSFNIDTLKIEEYLENKKNIKVKALIPIHLAGFPCEMDKIYKIAKKYNLFIIEDACHAFGAKWKDSKDKWQKVGSCSHSDMTVFSFHPVKHITTGEGGAITTNNLKIYNKLLLLKNHGITKNPDLLKEIQGPWYYEMHDLGFNYRLTDFQCALGISQLKKLDGFLQRRRGIARKYKKYFAEHSKIEVQLTSNRIKHSYHLFLILIDFKKLRISREKFMISLKRAGIGTQVHYIPIYHHPYYQNRFHYDKEEFTNAEEYYRKALSIPIYPKMRDKDADKVSKTIIMSMS